MRACPSVRAQLIDRVTQVVHGGEDVVLRGLQRFMPEHLLDLHGVPGRPPQVGGELAAERVRRPAGRVLHDSVDGVGVHVSLMPAREEVALRQRGHDLSELVAQWDDAVFAAFSVDDDALAGQVVDDVAGVRPRKLRPAQPSLVHEHDDQRNPFVRAMLGLLDGLGRGGWLLCLSRRTVGTRSMGLSVLRPALHTHPKNAVHAFTSERLELAVTPRFSQEMMSSPVMSAGTFPRPERKMPYDVSPILDGRS